MKRLATLLVVIAEGKVLLGMKKRGFGEGKWNGFGGKVEGSESIEEAAVRETEEECGIVPLDIKKVGILDFEFFRKPKWDQQVHIFMATSFAGKPAETEEMTPEWFEFAQIPYAKMWPDDKLWMPLLLAGKKFEGKFVFGEEGEISDYELNETD